MVRVLDGGQPGVGKPVTEGPDAGYRDVRVAGAVPEADRAVDGRERQVPRRREQSEFGDRAASGGCHRVDEVAGDERRHFVGDTLRLGVL